MGHAPQQERVLAWLEADPRRALLPSRAIAAEVGTTSPTVRKALDRFWRGIPRLRAKRIEVATLMHEISEVVVIQTPEGQTIRAKFVSENLSSDESSSTFDPQDPNYVEPEE